MNTAQRNFAGGELAPSLYARTDQSKYATGLRTMRNFIPQRHGGATNRPGSALVRALKDQAQPARLIPFVFDASQGNAYVLEFGDRTLRFAQSGGSVVVGAAAAWVTTTAYALADLVSQGGVTYYATSAHTSAAGTQPGIGATWASVWTALTGTTYEIPTPYAVADLPLLKYVQTADVMTLVHPSYAPRELARLGHTRWTLSTIPIGPSIGQVTNLLSSGGAAGSVRYWAVTAVDEATNEEGLPLVYSSTDRIASTTNPVLLTWNPVAGAIEYLVYFSQDGTTYGLKGPAGGAHQASIDTAWTTTSSSVTTSSAGAPVAAVTQARNPLAVSATDRAYDGNYTVKLKLTLTTSGGTGYGQVRAYYSRDGEPRVDAGIVATLFLNGPGSMANIPITGTLYVPDNGYTALTIDLVAELFPNSPSGPTWTCTVDTSTAPDNSIAWTRNATGFTDDGSAPNYEQAPPAQPTMFQGPTKYPSAVGIYQQRRIFANSAAEPERCWASRTGRYRNFATSTPLQSDDAVSWALAGRKVNAVRHILDLGLLVVFTSGAEQLVKGDVAEILRPGQINPKKISAHGASDRCAPLEVGDSALYVQERGSIVRDLKPVTDQSYDGTDLTVFAAHLFNGYTLADWAYAETPNSNVWAVRSDGVLLCLTYLREQAVWGWSRCDTDGAVENVCVIPEGGEDRVYLVVKRTINGATTRTLERLAVRTITPLTSASSFYFVDCGLTYDGRNTGSVTLRLDNFGGWDPLEEIALTISDSSFTTATIGNAYVFTDAAGTVLLRATAVRFSSTATVWVTVDRTVPLSMQHVPMTNWAYAVSTFSGLSHLEGKALSVLGDGFVVASPNNPEYATVTVVGGTIALGRPYALVHAGLPYTCDLETLDIDSPSGPSVKARKRVVKKVSLMFEATRGGFAGRLPPTGTNPLQDLDQIAPRSTEALDVPPALITGDADVAVGSGYDTNGRVFLRQVDPLPMTVLAIIPRGDAG